MIIMKYYFCFIFTLLFVLQISAESKNGKTISEVTNARTYYVSGTVHDLKTGELLVGVQVHIEGTDMKTYTDFDGTFSFINVKAGEYKVVTNYISYQPSTEKLEVSAKNNELKLKLQPSN